MKSEADGNENMKVKTNVDGTKLIFKKITFLLIIIRMFHTSRVGPYARQNVDSLHVSFGIYVNFQSMTLKICVRVQGCTYVIIFIVRTC